MQVAHVCAVCVDAWMRHEDGGTMCLLSDGDQKVMHG